MKATPNNNDYHNAIKAFEWTLAHLSQPTMQAMMFNADMSQLGSSPHNVKAAAGVVGMLQAVAFAGRLPEFVQDNMELVATALVERMRVVTSKKTATAELDRQFIYLLVENKEASQGDGNTVTFET